MSKEQNEPTFETNPGGCLGVVLGAALSALLVFLFFHWFSLPGKPRGVAGFIFLPFLIPLAVGWPLGAYIWRLCFPGIGPKANEQLVTCSCLGLFFLTFVGGVLLMVFGGAEVIEGFTDWLSQEELDD